MPVQRVNMCKCPDNTADAKTTRYFRVLINVMRIVVINEVVPERLAENKPSQARTLLSSFDHSDLFRHSSFDLRHC